MAIHELKEQIGRLPEQPGVYLYFNSEGDTIYVGKARALRDRVRNYLGAQCHLDIDNDELARMASYSPWHFIRAFRAAYQQTPHAYLVQQRLERARRLLRASPLAIASLMTLSLSLRIMPFTDSPSFSSMLLAM